MNETPHLTGRLVLRRLLNDKRSCLCLPSFDSQAQLASYTSYHVIGGLSDFGELPSLVASTVELKLNDVASRLQRRARNIQIQPRVGKLNQSTVKYFIPHRNRLQLPTTLACLGVRLETFEPRLKLKVHIRQLVCFYPIFKRVPLWIAFLQEKQLA